VTSNGGGSSQVYPMHTSHIKRAALNVQSPIAAGSSNGEGQSIMGVRGAQKSK